MKVIDLLNDIENDEIEDGTIFEVIGDFFYKLIVIDKNLYCINEMTKQLEILDSKYIGRFGNRQYEIIELSNKIEEEKKIPEKLKIEQDGHTYNNFYIVNQNGTKCYLTKHSKMIVETINQLIDYLKSKGDE